MKILKSLRLNCVKIGKIMDSAHTIINVDLLT